jgi:hypothetical protein
MLHFRGNTNFKFLANADFLCKNTSIKAPVLWDTTKKKNTSHMRYCVVPLRLVAARLLHASKCDKTLASDK